MTGISQGDVKEDGGTLQKSSKSHLNSGLIAVYYLWNAQKSAINTMTQSVSLANL
jgi:hypothetical protein